MKHPEQLDRHASGPYVRWAKRQAARLMRRLGKRLLDDAPRRLPWRGYGT